MQWKSNEQKKTAEQANLLISHNNTSVKTAHLFQQKVWLKMREVAEFWLRLQIVRKNVNGTKLSKKFVNQTAKVWIESLCLSIWAAEKISIELVSQAVITSLVVKKLTLSLNSSTWISSSNKTSWLIAKMKVLLCLRRSVQSPQEIHVRCVEIKRQSFKNKRRK